jgi:hypothetical protein
LTYHCTPPPPPIIIIIIIIIIIKMSRYRHGGDKGERTYSSYSFLISALDGVSDQRRAPAVFTPRERTPVPIGYKAGWASELVWTQRLEEKSFFLCRRSNPGRAVVQ